MKIYGPIQQLDCIELKPKPKVWFVFTDQLHLTSYGVWSSPQGQIGLDMVHGIVGMV